MQDNSTAGQSHSLEDPAPHSSENSNINTINGSSSSIDTSQPVSLASLEKRGAEDKNERPVPKSLTDMPAEVLMEIALQLPCQAFARFLQTNRYIHDTINTHYIWHRRFTTRFGQTILKSKLKLLLPKGSAAAPSSGPSSSRASTAPSSPRLLPGSDTNSGNSSGISSHTVNRDTPFSHGGLGLPGQYHNHLDPISSTTSPALSSEASSPMPSSASTPLVGGEGGGDDHGGHWSSGDGDNGNSDDDDEDAKKRAKGKGRKIDLRKTTKASKELLIELYRQYSRMTLPAEEMTICHMDGRYWKMIENKSSKFGKLAQLQSVWWMDIAIVFHGVPPGRYKVQWRVKATSDAPIINSEFKAVLFDKHEDNPGDAPNAILFKPRNVQEFIEQTDTRVTKANRKPFRNMFQKDFAVLELPGELLIEDDYRNVFVQICNHEGWKSGLFIDFARLVDLDNPNQSKELLSSRAGALASPVDEDVNDDGEEYYPTSLFSNALGIDPDVAISPLTFRSRAHRQYNPVNSSVQLDVGARSPTAVASGSGTASTSGSSTAGTQPGPSSTQGGRRQTDANGRRREETDTWYRIYAFLFLYCVYVFWTQ